MREKKGNGHKADLSGGEDLLGTNSQIASQLRAFYISIQEEEIPDKFLKLLEQLDRVEVENTSRNRKKVTANE